MAYDTYSLFDSLENDQTQQRVASRQALALAHTRVENKMGQFLRGARTEEEFFERLALIQDDFEYNIKNASAEVGYDHPEYIQASLVDHYKLASEPDPCPNCGRPGGCDHPEGEHDAHTHHAGFGETLKDFLTGPNKVGSEVEFSETPEDEEEEQQEQQGQQKEAARLATNATVPGLDPNSQMGLNGMQGQAQISPTGEYTPANGPSQMAQPVNPASQVNPQMGAPAQVPSTPETDPATLMQQNQQNQQTPMPGLTGFSSKWVISAIKVADSDWIEHAVKKPGELHKDLDVPEGEKIPESKLEEAEHSDNKKVRERAQFAENVKGSSNDNPADQDDNSSDEVSCPQCGGNGKTANNGTCTKCHGKGKVPNFGDSMVDHVATKSSWTIQADGNTDLGGPEPKIDKDHQTENNPKKDPLGNEDEGRWPTKQKDITEPIKAENREVGGKPNHELEEIGEKTTEHEDLPAAKENDTGFYDGGVTKQPAKSQWTGTDGQAKPVTRDKQ